MKYNTFLPRLIATIVDFIIFLLIQAILYFLVFKNNFIDIQLFIVIIVMLQAFYYGYFIYAHTKYGQTIGKAYANIKVVSCKDENRLLNLKEAVIRDMIGVGFVVFDIIAIIFEWNDNTIIWYISSYFIYIWLILELITMFFNEKRRSIHDLIASSVVINLGVIEEENTES
ncbi:hypothetical protein AD998_17005 [bacterium 336/3]|nr:hypothetical protein AD998_17005 [bacterium 336/3]